MSDEKARELLAAEYPDDGSKQLIMEAPITDEDDYISCALRAISRALQSSATERERAVAWIRIMAKEPPQPDDTGQALAREIACNFIADCIERGDHLTPSEPSA